MLSIHIVKVILSLLDFHLLILNRVFIRFLHLPGTGYSCHFYKNNA